MKKLFVALSLVIAFGVAFVGTNLNMNAEQIPVTQNSIKVGEQLPPLDSPVRG